jgi:addiction module RelE/StbE family toxin
VKITIRAKAYADLENIYRWIAKDSPTNAKSVVRRISLAIEDNLVPFPLSGRVGQKPGTRELAISGLPYLVIYEVDHARDLVIVQAIYHGAQNR